MWPRWPRVSFWTPAAALAELGVGQLHQVEPKKLLICMRTTINLPDALAEAAKAKAAAEGRTFTSVVEEGLRTILAVEPTVTSVTLPAYGTRGGEVLVDLADREALWAALDADGARGSSCPTSTSSSTPIDGSRHSTKAMPSGSPSCWVGPTRSPSPKARSLVSYASSPIPASTPTRRRRRTRWSLSMRYGCPADGGGSAQPTRFGQPSRRWSTWIRRSGATWCPTRGWLPSPSPTGSELLPRIAASLASRDSNGLIRRGLGDPRRVVGLTADEYHRADV